MYEKITVKALFDLNRTLAAPLLDPVDYPWEALSELKSFIVKLGPMLDETEFEQRGEGIWIAKTAEVAPTASINGPAIIGRGTQVRHCAFIRGSALIGDGAVVGNSTELKNVILFDGVQVPHYNYAGDSILGYKAHMGAGAVTSNVKSDKTLVTVRYEDEKLETGLKKLGAVLGDLVEIGCGSVLNPGTIIGKETSVYPLSMVRGYIPEGSIYKKQGEVVRRS